MLLEYLCKDFMLRIFLALFTALFLYSSCNKDSTAPRYDIKVPANSTTPCDTSALTWNNRIQRITISNCSYSPNTGCHYSGEGNYDFTSYDVVAARIRSGRFTERLLLPAGNALSMPPPGYARDSCALAQLMTWVSNGFPEN